MRRRFPAPTGRKVIAQGTALGLRRRESPSPERAARVAKPRVIRHGLFRPFRAGICFVLVPRALPWAITLRPFGAFGRKESQP